VKTFAVGETAFPKLLYKVVSDVTDGERNCNGTCKDEGTACPTLSRHALDTSFWTEVFWKFVIKSVLWKEDQ